MEDNRTNVALYDETKDLLDEYKIRHRKEIKEMSLLRQRVRIKHRLIIDDVVIFLLRKVEEYEKQEMIRQMKEQTKEVLEQKTENATNNNIQESETPLS